MKLSELVRIIAKAQHGSQLSEYEAEIMLTPLWQFSNAGSYEEAVARVSNHTKWKR